VKIETELGVGTRVSVYLPRAQSPAQRSHPSLTARALETTGEGGVILLVDDDEAVRETTAQMLQALGFEVAQAGSGGAALEMLDGPRRFDLLLLDFAMPGMNGADVAKAASARRPGLPILFVTGYADLAALANVGHPVIRKPFESRDLASSLASVLHRADDFAPN
jgi:CheY-like chemotaxis protein